MQFKTMVYFRICFHHKMIYRLSYNYWFHYAGKYRLSIVSKVVLKSSPIFRPRLLTWVCFVNLDFFSRDEMYVHKTCSLLIFNLSSNCLFTGAISKAVQVIWERRLNFKRQTLDFNKAVKWVPTCVLNFG